MSRVALAVNGREYSGWKDIRITRTVESLSGSFSLGVNDRWLGQDKPWPIFEGDDCQVSIDDETVIDGSVDRRDISFDSKNRSLAYAGRDKAAVLVDCSAVLDRWTFRNAKVSDLARKVAAPFGVDVHVQPGLELLRAPGKIAVSPGESAFDVIRSAAQAAGVMVVSTGAGGILITRAGTNRATSALIEGENILGGSVSYDGTGRYRKYIVATQTAGARIKAEAIDESVSRDDRVLIIRPEKSMTAEYARQYGDWEARMRAAQAEAVTINVHQWTQVDGSLWPLNALVPVRSPTLGIEGDLLISQAVHSVGPSGELTALTLVRPDAFTPNPKARLTADKSRKR